MRIQPIAPRDETRPRTAVRRIVPILALSCATALLLVSTAPAEDTSAPGAGGMSGATQAADVPAAPSGAVAPAATTAETPPPAVEREVGAGDETPAVAGEEEALVPEPGAAGADVTGAVLGLGGEFESEAARKKRREEAEKYAGAAFPPAKRVIRLSLKEAIEAALNYNLDIVVERYNPLLLERDVVVAKAQLYDPTFDSALSYTDQETPVASIFFPSGALREKITDWSFGLSQPTTIGGLVRGEFKTTRTDTNSPIESLVDTFQPVLSISLTQNLLKNFGWNVNRIILRRSQIGESKSKEALRLQVINSIFAVQEAYWQLVAARANLKVERLGLRLAEDLLRQNQIQVKVGTMAPIDVLQAEAQMKAAETNVIRAENAVRKAQNNLLRLTTGDNRLLTQNVRIETTDEPIFKPREVDFQQSLKTALSRRPELHVAALDMQDKTLAERGAKNNVLPSLELKASAGVTGLSGDPNPTINPFTVTSRTPDIILPVVGGGGGTVTIPGLPASSGIPAGVNVKNTPFAGQGSFGDATKTFFTHNQYSFWSVGMLFTYPLGNREARALHARSKLALEQSERVLTRTEQAVTQEVKDVVDNLDASARGVISTREARRLAEEQLVAEEKKLAVGLSTNFEVLQFQKDLTDRRREEIGALAAYKISQAQLARATGTILDDLNVEFLKEE